MILLKKDCIPLVISSNSIINLYNNNVTLISSIIMASFLSLSGNPCQAHKPMQEPTAEAHTILPIEVHKSQ